MLKLVDCIIYTRQSGTAAKNFKISFLIHLENLQYYGTYMTSYYYFLLIYDLILIGYAWLNEETYFLSLQSKPQF